MTTWFTADHHLGHWTSADGNIIKYCNRPFSTIEEMDRHLIQMWNDTVGENDTVYMQGDLTLSEWGLSYLRQLNGYIKVIAPSWHHDKRWLPDLRHDLNVAIYLGAEYVIQIEGVWLHLSHYPLAEWDRKHYGALHLHAHSHGKQLVPTNDPWITHRLDIGVDSAREWLGEYRPFSFEEVMRIMQGQCFDAFGWCGKDSHLRQEYELEGKS